MATRDHTNAICAEAMRIIKVNPDAKAIYDWLVLNVPAKNHCEFMNGPFLYLGGGTLTEHILKKDFRRIETALEELDSGTFI